MANFWKVRRELKRLRQQLRAVAEFFHEPRKQRHYDAERLSHLVVSDGEVPLLGKVALVVIHQPQGLRRSTVHTCRYLAAQGYAPFVVSNGALSGPDREELGKCCWKVAARPNYGYDFGAYRDGVLALIDWRIAPGTLLILNDSIWFPLFDDSRMVMRLEAAEGDIAGTILRRRLRSGASASVKTEIRFLESYCYRISGRAFADPAFAGFWRRYRMTDNKYKVIRRGERDFSLSMAAAGLSLAALFTDEDFHRSINGLDLEGLRKTVLYGAHSDDIIRSEQERLLKDFQPTAAWREAALEHIRKATEVGVFNSAFCYPTIGRLGADCLKKSAERINVLWREKFLSAVQAGDLSAPVPEILGELVGNA